MVVLALSYRPQQRVLHYVSDLAAAGVDVDLVLAESRSTENLSLDPRVRVSTIFGAELREVAVRRYERALVLQLPAKVIGKARSMTDGPGAARRTWGVAGGPQRLVHLVLEMAGRTQRRASRGVHRKLFWPAFKAVRPWLLVRYGRDHVEALDLAGADRIVAADTPAVPLAWRLARRYPEVRATTALDRHPYVAG
ncbi:MAG TPA: hypothetical protein VH502_04795 [Actinoplanes sp.]